VHFKPYGTKVAPSSPSRRVILEGDLDFDSLLKLTLQLSKQLEIEPLLRTAETLFSHAGVAGQELLQALP
jgi:hypothetical protein